MSRIGRLPVPIPQGVEVRMEGDVFHAKGPKGEFSTRIPTDMTVAIEAGEVRVARPTEQKRHRALHGLSRTLIANCITGVHTGFTRKLEIRGVGYRAEVQGNKLVLQLGYSNPVEFPVPEGIQIAVEGQNIVTISGIDKQRVGQVAANIRGLRPPEPYKGKGVRYENGHVRQKAGKTAGK